MQMEPLIVTLHEILIGFRAFLVFLSVQTRQIFVSLGARVCLLVELRLSGLEGLSVLEVLAIEIKVFAH